MNNIKKYNAVRTMLQPSHKAIEINMNDDETSILYICKIFCNCSSWYETKSIKRRPKITIKETSLSATFKEGDFYFWHNEKRTTFNEFISWLNTKETKWNSIAIEAHNNTTIVKLSTI